MCCVQIKPRGWSRASTLMIIIILVERLSSLRLKLGIFLCGPEVLMLLVPTCMMMALSEPLAAGACFSPPRHVGLWTYMSNSRLSMCRPFPPAIEIRLRETSQRFAARAFSCCWLCVARWGFELEWRHASMCPTFMADGIRLWWHRRRFGWDWSTCC